MKLLGNRGRNGGFSSEGSSASFRPPRNSKPFSHHHRIHGVFLFARMLDTNLRVHFRSCRIYAALRPIDAQGQPRVTLTSDYQAIVQGPAEHRIKRDLKLNSFLGLSHSTDIFMGSLRSAPMITVIVGGSYSFCLCMLSLTTTQTRSVF